MRYKWLFNGKNAANGFGNTTPSFTVTNIGAHDAGLYSVEIKNASGRVVSSNATLTIIAPPATLTSPQMTPDGFRLQLAGMPGATYVIEATTNLTDWIPLSTNAAPSGTVTFTDTSATNRGFTWYRARLLQAIQNTSEDSLGPDTFADPKTSSGPPPD